MYIFINHLGEEKIAKLPSLKLKKWNATRWLGRASCLVALCGAYEYILDHLHYEMEKNQKVISQFVFTDLQSEIKVLAKGLYEHLTSYENFMFIWFYRDVTVLLANYSRLLQTKDLQIPDVGHLVIRLSEKLQMLWSNDISVPRQIGDGKTFDMMQELFEVDNEDDLADSIDIFELP